jgi:protein phosphatase
LHFELPSTLKQAKGVKADDFINLVENTTDLLRSENGKTGNQIITGRLTMLQPDGDALIIGDLHGDIKSLTTILEKSDFITKMNTTNDAVIVFLGDYGDRGANQTELYYTVLSLKVAFPEQIVLLRGNHEGPLDLMASPHDLPLQLQQKFKDKGALAYLTLRKLFDYLYNAAYVENQYLLVHGGLPYSIRNLHEIAQAGKLHPDKPFLSELLWNDPDDKVKSILPSPRGSGNLFGKTTTKEVLDRLNAKIIIRGHEATPDGYKINHDGKVLTLFSRKGAPYSNTYGAYLDVPLEKKFETANQLISYIHKF